MIWVDLGFGPARLLPVTDVAAVAHALNQLDAEALRARMNPSAMEGANLYPFIWDEDDVFDTYLAPAFEGLRAFYSAAAHAQQAVIQTLC